MIPNPNWSLVLLIGAIFLILGGILWFYQRRRFSIRRHEGDLEKSLNLLQATLDSTADGILVVDSSGRMVGFNKTFVKMWRVPQPIIDSRDDESALAYVFDQLKDPEGFLKKVKELYAKPEAGVHDILEFKDGRLFERFSQPQKIEEKIVGRVWSFRDVTDRKRAEQEIKRYTEELQRSNKELEQFGYVASHDLQEPLRTIILYGDLLKEHEEVNLSKKGQDYLRRIQRAASRMNELIEDLLELARVNIRSGSFEVLNLEEVIRDVLADIEFPLKKTDGEFSVEPLPLIQANRQQMRQLFLNLFSNAIKFRHAERQLEVQIKGRIQNKNLILSVEDNGIGFENIYRQQIFEPFQRLHGRSEYEGTGVGLAICKKIIQRHKGKLHAESQVGKGTRFVVELPLTQAQVEDLSTKKVNCLGW